MHHSPLSPKQLALSRKFPFIDLKYTHANVNNQFKNKCIFVRFQMNNIKWTTTLLHVTVSLLILFAEHTCVAFLLLNFFFVLKWEKKSGAAIFFSLKFLQLPNRLKPRTFRSLIKHFDYCRNKFQFFQCSVTKL